MIDEAIIYATGAHSGQKRKLTGTPYILHPLEVASIISTMTSDQSVIAAGILHDTIEDADVSPEQIRARFGERVWILVDSETEKRTPGENKADTWEARKRESLDRLASYDDTGVKMLWLADKLSNIRSFYREWCVTGDDMWLSLNMKDKTKHAYYYRRIAELVAELKDTTAYKEYVYLMNKLFGGEENVRNSQM